MSGLNGNVGQRAIAGIGRVRWVRAAFRGRVGMARLGLLLAVVAAAVGMSVGNGVASTQTRSVYDLAWLPDGARGQLVQVDPVLGRANVRLQVADPGSTLSIQQGNGQLVVVDRKTGKITSIDLGTLLVGGSRAERPGAGVKVMLAGARLYVADLPRGTVRAVDPSTQADIGTPWSAGRSLVDVGVDGAHDVWALDSGQHLSTLRWNGSTLRQSTVRTVEGAGPGSVIVGHDRGVTLVGSRGAIVRVGTGRDARLDAPRISGPLNGPLRSPAGIVPVADPRTSSVVIVGPRDAVVDDVSSYGCSRPGAPTVFDNKVYVPCVGAHRVLVLDVNGTQVGASIPTPGHGDPQLTVSGGRLVIDVPGAGRATVVDPSGKRRDFPTVAPGIGVQNASSPPPSPPPAPKRSEHDKRVRHDAPRNGFGGNHGGGADHGAGGGHGTTRNPGGNASGGPAGAGGASAQVRPDGSVLVSWSSAGRTATAVTATTTGDEVARVPAGATSATVTVLDPGTTTAFHVRNADLDATTNSVTTATVPSAAAGVIVTSRGISDGVATLAVTWRAAAGNGAPVSYTVSAGGAATRTTSRLNATLSVPCASGCSGSVTVTARNSAGAGTSTAGTYTVTPAAQPQPQPNPNPQPNPDPQPNPNPQPQPQPTTQAPAPIAMPADGQNMLTATATAGNDQSGNPATVTLSMTPPADWAAFPGTCTVVADGADEGAVPCNASGVIKTFEYYESGSHEYWVTASDSGRTVSSAHITRTVRYTNICLNSAGERKLTGVGGTGPMQRPVCDGQPTCPNCQIPFAQPRFEPLPSREPVRRTDGVGGWLR